MHEASVYKFQKKSGQKLNILIWKAARSTHPTVWERVMLTIKELNIDAYKYLIVIPPRYIFLIILIYKYLIHIHLDTDVVIDAGSGINLGLVVEPYITQLSTI